MRTCVLIFCCTVLLFQPAISQTVGNIPLPTGYSRIPAADGTFAAWLRKTGLKGDKTVYLYNGERKANQQAQFAVLNISIGNKDLQQCADAVMRLYAEYLYSEARFDKIAFHATDGTLMDYAGWRNGYRFVLRGQRLQRVKTRNASTTRESFDAYLQAVFSYAGTLSLSRELKPVSGTRDIMPGDVFIQGGSPGHAVIVIDVAVNAVGEKQFLLAQSYMPAQSIHILKNPLADSPWYSNQFTGQLYTPEWTFPGNSLRRW
jgi:hypothetical protein